MNSEVQNLVAAGKLTAADGEKLSKLEPGTYCLHKSWGVGKIAEWDLMGDKVILDFEDKAGHGLKISFAVTSLEILPADHLLARRHANLGELKSMAKENVTALIELALKSSGNSMSLDDLERLLKPRIVGEGEYKKWWEAAKKTLKAARHIVVPSKRTEPLVLRESGEKPGGVMVKNFLAKRDLKGKLAVLTLIQKDLDLFEDAATELLPVFQDISDTVRKAWRLHLKDSLQLLLARDEIIDAIEGASLPMGSMKVADLVCEAKPLLAENIGGLPVGQLGRMYRAFPEAFPERVWVPEILNHLTRTGGRAVAEIAVVLDSNNELDVLTEFLKKSVRNRTLSADLLIWICKERKGLAASVFSIDLGNAILDACEDDHVQGGPKRTGRLGDMLSDDKTLVHELVVDTDDESLRNFAKRIINTAVLDELTRRSLMARVIKARPEMEALMADNAEAREDNRLIVSWDSLEKKKAELTELVNVKIPHNKHEIQIAKEEGDLRENGGYKAARDQQAVLNRMKDQLEREVGLARGTDFANVSTEKVGVGTIVDFQDVATGETETYTILGAWDGDLDKNIVSYLSEIAKALIGKAVGEEADLPSDEGEARKVKVLAIRAFNTGAA
ncbi:Transcription elongation factor, GreA/GreB family [Prosthecobacter debontii]|uniref:Transcription elongation factor GreA n=1 Tax=Prosthecobacter debontii TaxID=48467 RepID=A0A1T4YSN8_9BACT|nr:GreA/GreB family elongation factor [Prosthecobacter debontii]SKB04762.1 Transcription elongation factor, GreA/GreB family [Prosthecobacter debontii]